MITVLHVVSCMNRAGQETFIMNIYRNIDRSKVQFSFLCYSHEKGDYDDEIIELGGKIYYVPCISGANPLSYTINKIHVLKNWFIDHRQAFNVVHIHTYHASDVLSSLESLRQAGVKNRIIHSHNSCGPHVTYHKICRFLCQFYRYDKFACGKEAAKWLHGNEYFKSNVNIIYNGIDTEKFRFKDEVRDRYRQSLNLVGKYVIGHIGRFNYQKNHKKIIDVFKSYSEVNNNAVLLLVGKGELEGQIKTMVDKAGLSDKVFFLGTREDIPELLSAMDVFLFPSLHEGFSVCSIEVQCSGLPIITSDIPSMRESDLTGLLTFLSLQSSSYDWAKCIGDKNVDRKRGEFCTIVKNKGFDIKTIARKLESEYLKY